MQLYGYLGAYTYNQITTHFKTFKSRPENFIYNLVDFYNKNNHQMLINIFTSNLDNFQNIIKTNLLARKEITLLKVILDLILHFYKFVQIKEYIVLINEILPVVIMFYSYIGKNDVKMIYDKLNLRSKNVKNIICMYINIY